MTAAQAGDHDLAGFVIFRKGFFLVFETDVGVNAAGAADVEFAFGLGVEVEQDVAFEDAGLEGLGTDHPGFLVNGEEGFDGAVLEGLGLQDRHGGGYAQTVVGTQGRAAGVHPVAVFLVDDAGFDRIFGEIVLLVVVLLRDHVHMGLQDDALAVFHARRGRFADDDVAAFILESFQAEVLAEFDQELGYFLRVSGRTGNLGERVEIVPDALGF